MPKAKSVLSNLLALAENYRDTVCAGRTHGQQALPVTMGFKFAVYAEEIKRDIARIEGCADRLFVGQFAGAVGTIASLGPVGMQVMENLMHELKLGVPTIHWYQSRDNVAEFICALTILGQTLGKIGNEIVILQKTEFSELEEPFHMGKVGSSTMPHKRNPTAAQNLVMLSSLLRSEAMVILTAMQGEHERDFKTLPLEWDCLGRVCCMIDASLTKAEFITAGLVVHPENMMRNLDLLKGLMMSEAVMMSIGADLGRQEAHEIVYEACMEAFEQNMSLADALWKAPAIRAHFNRDDLDKIVDPNGYTGNAGLFVDRVLDNKAERSSRWKSTP